jgi:hypothetical protein
MSGGIFVLNPPSSGGGITESQLNAQKGVANGLASLDEFAKIPIGQIPTAIVGTLNYKGAWDCSTHTYPSPAVHGDYYICSVAGTMTSDGMSYNVRDILIYGDDSWEKIDYSYGHTHQADTLIVNTTTFNGKLSASNTTVQSALNTLDDHTHAVDSTSVSVIVSGFGGTVLTSSENTVQKALDRIDDYVAPISHNQAATTITTTTSGFNNILTASDSTVQAALDTLDNSLVYNSSLGCIVFTYNT